MADQIGTNEMKIRREIAIMRRLDHPNIVKLIDVLDDPLEKKVYIGMLRTICLSNSDRLLSFGVHGRWGY
jgi:serine/threonine protein kinase